VHLQLPSNFTDNSDKTSKFTHLTVRLKTASELKPTVFGKEFQTLTSV